MLVIGLIIITLAFSLMVISIQLLLHKNNENITKLSMLGYTSSEISLPYRLMVLILFAITFICSMIPLFIFRNFYSSNLILLGYENSVHIIYNVILPGMGFISLVVLSLVLMVNRNVRGIILKPWIMYWSLSHLIRIQRKAIFWYLYWLFQST